MIKVTTCLTFIEFIILWILNSMLFRFKKLDDSTKIDTISYIFIIKKT